jgi:hypothetical protein
MWLRGSLKAFRSALISPGMSAPLPLSFPMTI